MIYDVLGNSLNTAYDIDGDELTHAYDIDGNDVLTSSTTLVVMSYNIQWLTGINSNQAMQESILSTYKPDIIGMQEVTRSDSFPSMATTLLSRDYPSRYLGSQTNKTAIASKKTLSNVTSAVFSSQASETRGYQKAYFAVGGKTVCWINTHLETSSYESVKVAQAKEVFEMVRDEEYFIITGDFNTVCKSVNDTEYTTIMKQFINAGYHSANCSTQHGFLDTWTSGSTASGTWYPCDHVITSPNIEITNVVVDTDKIDIAAQTGQSIDHLPIIAYLTIN